MTRRLILLMLILLAPSRLRAQISPGPLARAHAALEGPTNCTKCHGLRREPVTQMCLGCHREVAWLIAAGRGVHAREARATSGGGPKKECASCHPDHAGQDFALIQWPAGGAARFDHRRAGWALEGKHADAKCESCHATAYRVSPAAALSPRRGTAGWMGLETSCVSCHRVDDAHQGALGAQCASCHDTRGWTPAPAFDHASTRYPLTGKHTTVECAGCHLTPRLPVIRNAAGERVPVFKPVPFRACSSCHTDPHRGKLSGQCSDCHVTRGFDVVDQREFDHAATRYPLRGKHAAVSCAGCHGPNLATRDPPFATCASCHADVHRGEATLGGRATDCQSCHRVEGFSPATYSVAQHRGAPFPLEGAHERVVCTACHRSLATGAAPARTAAVRIRMPYATCGSCHSDAHGSQLAARPDKGACEACHVVAAWTPSTFARAAHATLRLPLDGRHAAISCASCHATNRRGLPPIPRPERLGAAHVAFAIPAACTSCHVDPHGGRYGTAPNAPSCLSCHDTKQFRPSTVDVAGHARFAFALEGAHRAVPCAGCHTEITGGRAGSTLVAAAAPVRSLPFAGRGGASCQSCHESPHGDQFAARRDRGACESCHGVDRFAPAARFDHDRDAAFSLAGAHARVACARCHRPETTPAGVTRVVYRPLSAKCESCHGGVRRGP
jgi:cytochrome c7-like protein